MQAGLTRLYAVKDEPLKWLEQLGDSRAEWLRQLPFSLSIPSLNLLVVHAGLIPGVPVKQQSLKTLTEVGLMTVLQTAPHVYQSCRTLHPRCSNFAPIERNRSTCGNCVEQNMISDTLLVDAASAHC